MTGETYGERRATGFKERMARVARTAGSYVLQALIAADATGQAAPQLYELRAEQALGHQPVASLQPSEAFSEIAGGPFVYADGRATHGAAADFAALLHGPEGDKALEQWLN